MKLIKTAGIELESKDVQATALEIAKRCQDLGGMVYHQEFERRSPYSNTVVLSSDSVLRMETYQPHIDMQLRVPVTKLSGFVDSLQSHQIAILHSYLDIEDASLRAETQQMKLEARQQAINETAKKPGIDTMIRVYNEGIEDYRQARQIDADASYSLVKLELSQPPVVSRQVLSNTDIDAYHEPFRYRFVQALKTGWQGIQNLFLVVLSLWSIWLPLLLIWMVYRKKIKLLFSQPAPAPQGRH